MAADNGQLQLNAFEPLIAHLLLQSTAWLTHGCAVLRTLCVDGITANERRFAQQATTSVGAVTALTPHIGYEAAASIAKQALATGNAVADLVAAESLLDRHIAARLLSQGVRAIAGG
ncbi:hypothetical protein [Streptacidiphilus jiangxiensis]|nr:hypothetical protein [Streptacidiphilus jiangxiensis]